MLKKVNNLFKAISKLNSFVDVWENKFKFFRGADRLKCDKCSKYSKWKYCLGDYFHTFNFDI